jgi:glutathione S-transferase
MRLLVTRASPYARKARAAVIELGLEDLVQVVDLPIRLPQDAKPDVEALNPLGKIPALILKDGTPILDSPVILAYLDERAGGRLIPAGPDKWRVLTLEALADGAMDAGFVLRMEQLKDPARQDPAEIAAYTAKIERTLDRIEQEPEWLSGEFNAGQRAGLRDRLDDLPQSRQRPAGRPATRGRIGCAIAGAAVIGRNPPGGLTPGLSKPNTSR